MAAKHWATKYWGGKYWGGRRAPSERNLASASPVLARHLPPAGFSLRFRAVVKRMLPRSLLGRSLLMILLPLLILEGVALEVFYGSHISVVSRRLADTVADELGFTIDLMQHLPGAENTAWIFDLARTRFGLDHHAPARRQAGIDELDQRVWPDGR